MSGIPYPVDSLITNPCLLAIVVTVSTHTGPEFVFHYPPNPDNHDYKAASFKATWQESSSNPSSLTHQENTSSSSSSSSSDLDSDLSSSNNEDSFSDKSCDSSNYLDDPSNLQPKSFNNTNDSFIEHLGSETSNQLNSKRKSYKSKTPFSNKHHLTRTERNPLSPFLKNVVATARLSPAYLDHTKFSPWETTRKNDAVNNPNNPNTEEPSSASSKHHSNDSDQPANSLDRRDKNSKSVLGFNTDYLSKLLSPPLSMCNAQFDFSVDDMTFLGMPIHIKDGQWMQKRKRYFDKSSLNKVPASNHESLDNHTQNNKESAPIDPDSDHAESIPDQPKKSKPLKADSKTDEPLPGASNMKRNDPNDSQPSTMKMFHVSFVVNPPVREYPERITQFYQCIASRFSKKLRYEQAKSNYVWKEISKILKVQENIKLHGLSATEGWSKIAKVSPLAVAVSKIFIAISNSEIAKFTLNGKPCSLQIPIITQIDNIPGISKKVYCGTELSTLPSFSALDGKQDRSIENLALLLLSEPGAIIRYLDINPASHHANLLRILSPTKSITELSLKSGYPPTALLTLADRLIYWRCARAIFPVSGNNIYVVSPLAPMTELYKFSQLFTYKFPKLPSLPELLSKLSAKQTLNKVFNLASDREQKKVYLEAIGWMIKYGLITLLQTFIFIKIPYTIRKQVNLDIDQKTQAELSCAQEVIKSQKRSSNMLSGPLSYVQEDDLEDDLNDFGFNHNDQKSDTDSSNKHNFSGYPTSILEAPHSSNMIGSTGSYSKTAGLYANALSTSVTGGMATTIPTGSVTASVDDGGGTAITEECVDDTIIPDPKSASPRQIKWISKMLENKPADCVKVFRKLMKYMDGGSAMEWAIVQESLTFEDFEKLVSELKDYFIITRHW